MCCARRLLRADGDALVRKPQMHPGSANGQGSYCDEDVSPPVKTVPLTTLNIQRLIALPDFPDHPGLKQDKNSPGRLQVVA